MSRQSPYGYRANISDIITTIKQELQILATASEFNSPGVSVDNMWDHFERNVRRIMDTCIPHKMTSSRYNLPWFNRSFRRQKRAKKRLYDNAKKSGNPVHRNDFRAARKRLQKNLKSAREAYISDFLRDAIKENPKRFWSYIKHLKNADPGVSDFKVEGKIVSDGRAKSEILKEHYQHDFATLLVKTDENYIYGLLTKIVRSRWRNIGQVLFFFGCLWTEMESRSTNSQKKNEANIQPS